MCVFLLLIKALFPGYQQVTPELNTFCLPLRLCPMLWYHSVDTTTGSERLTLSLVCFEVGQTHLFLKVSNNSLELRVETVKSTVLELKRKKTDSNKPCSCDPFL